MKKRKLYKRLLILLVLVYAIFTLANQQKVLNQYTENSKELGTKIEEQQVYNNELVAKKENVDSKEFIEQMAREKLEMYYPNEKVYIDKGM
jgi:cell division protein ftsL